MEKSISDAHTRAHVHGGVCVESIPAACTIRLRRCSNVWTTRTFVSPNRCGTTRNAPRLTLSVGSTPHDFRRTAKRSSGSRPAERQRGIQRARTRTSAMTRHGRRHQQVGERHDGYLAIDE